MHCTGQASTQARSFTSMHASVMIARPAMAQLLAFRGASPGSGATLCLWASALGEPDSTIGAAGVRGPAAPSGRGGSPRPGSLVVRFVPAVVLGLVHDGWAAPLGDR